MTKETSPLFKCAISFALLMPCTFVLSFIKTEDEFAQFCDRVTNLLDKWDSKLYYVEWVLFFYLGWKLLNVQNSH